MAETGRLTWREGSGLIVEAPDGRVLAVVEIYRNADFTCHPGLGWMDYDAFELKWLQLPDEVRGYVDGTCEEVPIPIALLEAGDGG